MADLRLWDLEMGRPRPCFEELQEEPSPLQSLSFLDPETAFLVAESRVDLWSVPSCKRLLSVTERSGSFNSAAISQDRRFVMTGDADGTTTLWDTGGGVVWRSLAERSAVISVAVSPDGSRALTGSADGTARFWQLDTETEPRLLELQDAVTGVGFSPDGTLAFTATSNVPSTNVLLVTTMLRFDRESFDERLRRGGEIRLWEVAGWRELSRTTMFPIGAATFSSDGRTLLVGSDDGMARLLEVPSAREIGRWETDAQGITAVGFVGADGRLLTAGRDGLVRIWDARPGNELVRLASFVDGDWAVATPQGRFDTNDPGKLEELSWVVSDDPFTPLPVDSFVREYYEPRLLARTLWGERLPPLPSIAELNRVRPDVRIVGVTAHGRGSPQIDVAVEVAGREKMFRRGSAAVAVRSGAKEVRLYRDGRLVGTYPPPGTSWQLDPPLGKATIIFPNVCTRHLLYSRRNQRRRSLLPRSLRPWTKGGRLLRSASIDLR